MAKSGKKGPTVKSVVDTIMGEARAHDFEDMLSIASTIHNRSTVSGVPAASIVATQQEFNAYGKAFPPGVNTAKSRALAEKAWAQVQKSGPVHNGTYYATPSATKNLPPGLSKIGQFGAHVVYADPKNRAFHTALGYKKPDPKKAQPVQQQTVFGNLLTRAQNTIAGAVNTAVQSQKTVQPAQPERGQRQVQKGLGLENLTPNAGYNAVGSYDRTNLDPSLNGVLNSLGSDPRFGGLAVRSGYRSPERNRAVGGAKNSQHIQGKAVDIAGFRDLSPDQQAALVDKAMTQGARGVGLYRSGALHLDTRQNPAAWGPQGYSSSPLSTFPAHLQPAVAALRSLPPGQVFTPAHPSNIPTPSPAANARNAAAVQQYQNSRVQAQAQQQNAVTRAPLSAPANSVRPGVPGALPAARAQTTVATRPEVPGSLPAARMETKVATRPETPGALPAAKAASKQGRIGSAIRETLKAVATGQASPAVAAKGQATASPSAPSLAQVAARPGGLASLQAPSAAVSAAAAASMPSQERFGGLAMPMSPTSMTRAVAPPTPSPKPSQAPIPASRPPNPTPKTAPVPQMAQRPPTPTPRPSPVPSLTAKVGVRPDPNTLTTTLQSAPQTFGMATPTGFTPEQRAAIEAKAMPPAQQAAAYKAATAPKAANLAPALSALSAFAGPIGPLGKAAAAVANMPAATAGLQPAPVNLAAPPPSVAQVVSRQVQQVVPSVVQNAQTAQRAMEHVNAAPPAASYRDYHAGRVSTVQGPMGTLARDQYGNTRHTNQYGATTITSPSGQQMADWSGFFGGPSSKAPSGFSMPGLGKKGMDTRTKSGLASAVGAAVGAAIGGPAGGLLGGMLGREAFGSPYGDKLSPNASGKAGKGFTKGTPGLPSPDRNRSGGFLGGLFDGFGGKSGGKGKGGSNVGGRAGWAGN